MWDLAISDHGDLVMTGHRDLGGKSGTDLIEQRMVIRLKLARGSWVYDDTDGIGSNLHELSGVAPEKAALVAPAYVREALRGMDEIVVDDVRVSTASQQITVVVFYHLIELTGGTSADQTRQLEISLPLSGGGV